MLFAVDIGNTNTVIGIFEGEMLKKKFRLSTNPFETSDEISIKLSGLIDMAGIETSLITDVIVSSVVPSMTAHYIALARETFGHEPLIVGPGLKTGISILYDNPKEVGADRVANSVGGVKLYGSPLIIVDLGTAITFDAISEKGDYLGGAISPGIETSLASLSKKAAQLPQVSLALPEKVIGKNTIQSMQSGTAYGFGGMIETIVERMKGEIGGEPKVVATGGQCEWLKELCSCIDETSPDLTLFGLYHIYLLNR